MKKIFATTFLMLLVVPVVTFAQATTATATTNPCSNAGKTSGEAATALPKCVNQIYVWSLGIAALLALLMIVVGGYFIMTAGGNAEQSAKGKEFITSALIGVAILFMAYLLLNQINPDLVNFNLESLKGINPTTETPGPIRDSR